MNVNYRHTRNHQSRSSIDTSRPSIPPFSLESLPPPINQPRTRRVYVCVRAHSIPLNRNIPSSRDRARFPIRISPRVHAPPRVFRPRSGYPYPFLVRSRGARPPPLPSFPLLARRVHGPSGPWLVVRHPPCLPKVLRCLSSARALIVIYNHHGPCPVARR